MLGHIEVFHVYVQSYSCFFTTCVDLESDVSTCICKGLYVHVYLYVIV